MQYTTTVIPQLFVGELDIHGDERGFFARMWSQSELAEQGLPERCTDVGFAYNLQRGTLRGMHYQVGPFSQAKSVRVLRGAIHDVVLDLRPDSPAFEKWFAVELTASNRRTLFIPEGCAHGYLTLTDEAEVLYTLSGAYEPHAERGIRWDSPLLQGAWPFDPIILSKRDQQFPTGMTDSGERRVESQKPPHFSPPPLSSIPSPHSSGAVS